MSAKFVKLNKCLAERFTYLDTVCVRCLSADYEIARHNSAVIFTLLSPISHPSAVKLEAIEKNELNDKQQAALEAVIQDAVIVEVSLVITHADGTET